MRTSSVLQGARREHATSTVTETNLVLRPFLLLAVILSRASSYSLGTWSALTVPGGSAYHPAWAPVLLFEAIINVYFLVGAVFLLFAFLGRKRVLPRAFIVHAISVGILKLLDESFVLLLPMGKEDSDPPPFAASALSLTIALGWCWYFAVSRRVRSTFVR